MLPKNQSESCDGVFHFRVEQLLQFENYRRAVLQRDQQKQIFRHVKKVLETFRF